MMLRKRMGGRRSNTILWMGLIGLMLILSACFRSHAATPAPPTPNPALMELDAHAFSAQLTVTDSLAHASEQLAATAGVAEDAIRVLFRTETCTICGQTSGESDGKALAELAVDEAAPLLAPGSSFWLNVPPLACLYAYDGRQVKPQGCRIQ
ncbi:MAG: hypothetical protein KF893_16445 [Caldilineaceae bacterium]|nr:hypothetical protein [Caldilineaceae bacterium]